ncbi:SCO1664 family protein [Streptomyces sp. NRRL F-5123]|uniref:SCO1664 family protein n=1 Tax=Streptomyces sp. NRRL F-5123 TaxID=1463856 RepID=UPI0004E27A1A|nr:SCO1664 family protein [Streptomyces sp. NRRL F-5123]
MPASERVPEVGLSAAPAALTLLTLLSEGELTVRGRVRDASNAVLYCEAAHQGVTAACVYKPVAGERPLWDFPDGTLAQREVAAFLVSEATGWGLVPPTVLRDGPYGEGMVQLWIDPAADGDADGDGSGDDGGSGGPALLALTEDTEPAPGWKAVVEAEVGEGRTALLVHADDDRLRRLAVLDAVINNADRKGGHLLPAPDGKLYGIDHGVTFHTEDKLRTLLWGWAGEPLPAEAVAALEGLTAALDGELGVRLGPLITAAEIGALRARVARLLETGIHPLPGGGWPSIPWPPV